MGFPSEFNLLRITYRMSWQAYVDQQLVGTGHVTKGTLLGHDGATWAATPGFTISPAEGQKLAAQFNDPASASSQGVTIAGRSTCACALTTAPSTESTRP